jgi:tRNA nucleotidyltransferase (CCA-adding enzyme)
MERYLVGGAVRDQLLGLPPRERDWLLTGTNADQLIARGFHPAGRDFTVFLHPESKEEYALPRAMVHAGVSAREQVEADLRCRDLTINAIAQAADGTLIDPLNGQADLQKRLLRHTPAFAEDPIRVLRLARLQARMADLGFRIADETRSLVQAMARRGDLEQLVPERVWGELVKALQGPAPGLFITALRECHALAPILPELDRLFGIPQPARYHPEIDSGIHSLLTLERACELSPLPEIRLAALLHDLGKGTTPPQQWPRHIGHEARGARLVEGVCQRLRAPNRFRQLAVAVARFHIESHRALALRPKTLLRLLQHVDALRRPQRLDPFCLACQADLRGRPGHENEPYPQARFLHSVCNAARNIDSRALLQNTPAKQIPQRIQQARLQAIRAAKTEYEKDPVTIQLP